MTGDMGTRKASWGMAKRATAFILSFVMAFNTIPTQALADDVAVGKQNEGSILLAGIRRRRRT